MGWFGGASGAHVHVREIDVRQARERQQRGALLVDVRESDEWRAQHALGAQHVPLGALAKHLGTLPRDRDLLLICRSGNRSGHALALLTEHGFDRALNVSGGMQAWVRAALPTTTGT